MGDRRVSGFVFVCQILTFVPGVSIPMSNKNFESRRKFLKDTTLSPPARPSPQV